MKCFPWYVNIVKNKVRTLYCNAQYFEDCENVSNEYLYCLRAVYNEDNYDEVIGAIRIGIPRKDIDEILRSGQVFENYFSVIYNEDTVLIATGKNKETLLENWNVAKTKISSDVNKGKIRIGNCNYKFITDTIKFSEWNLAVFLPMKTVLHSYFSMTVKSLMLAMLMFLILIYCNSKMFKVHTQKLNMLLNAMQRYDINEMTILKYDNDGDDIDCCIAAYNSMITNMSKMISEQIEIKRKLYEYNIKILYERINPHFLYNTLEIINNMALVKDCYEISDVICQLAEYYRISLNNTQDVISLRDEIRHCELYIDMCNKRFSKNIIFCNEVQDELLDTNVLKMIFQPIVENSIKYGFIKNDKTDNIIIIEAYKNNSGIEIRITDNGIGIKKEKLDRLNDIQSEGSATGIGLKSTDERLKLFYGKDSGIKIISEYGKYTTVVINIGEI